MSAAPPPPQRGSEKIIIIPTYNERENIGRLLERVMALPFGLNVLVVDDGSPDGTAAIVKEWQSREPRVHLMQRAGKLGLGSAYRDGFRYALDRGFEYIFEMDADFSHDPDAIGGFLTAAEEADVVLGSRYLNGISVVNWPLQRLLLSYFANAYTRWVTGLPLRDATGGFKCFRRRALEGIRLDKVKSDGYGFQIEMSFRCWKKGFKIKEIPILFVDRLAGVSKMSRRIVYEAAFMVWRLRLQSLVGRLE
ncbi:MAG: polyprenol monophosphomannose synthase [Candidatus Eisenbacteria bacterium]